MSCMDNQACRVVDTVDLDDPSVVVGRHSVWVPQPADGGVPYKFPFQLHGRVRKYTRPAETSYDLWSTLTDEVAILHALSTRRMAPPIGSWVYVKHVLSSFGGVRRSDPIGAYGYEMADANTRESGAFDLAAMQTLPIVGSPGAWGDVGKPGNVVNGYLVDVRRTAWDMLKWQHELPARAAVYVEDAASLEARVRRDCQFPAGQRPEPYQDFWLRDRWVAGSRRVAERAYALGFAPGPGQSVLDIGCQSGGFLHYSWLEQTGSGGGAGAHVGIDVSPEYVECARDLARAAGWGIDVHVLDAGVDILALLALSQARFAATGGRPDHLLLLSMEKHLPPGAIWQIIDGVAAARTYVETNAYAGSGAGRPGGPEGKGAVEAEILDRGGVYLGDSSDRNPRRLYRIERTP